MQILESLFLGVLQGLTEWLPISSSGHLVIAQEYLNIQAPLFFDILLHLATILVILIAAILLFVVFFGIGHLVNFLASKNYYLYLRVYSYFANISLLIQFLAFYFVILLNRISFYAITLEKNFKK